MGEFVVLLVVSAAFWIGGVRNYQVYRWHIRLLNAVSKEAQRRINSYEFDTWRSLYDELDTADQTEMILKFWRPLDSFMPATLRQYVR